MLWLHFLEESGQRLIFAKMKRMCKTYKTKEEAVAAFKKAVEARGVWEEAIRNGISREDVEKKGLKPAEIHAD